MLKLYVLTSRNDLMDSTDDGCQKHMPVEQKERESEIQPTNTQLPSVQWVECSDII